ncbi:MAG: flavodoxin [Pseudomonadota bacterium]|jgi:flavodoxin I/flavodoxin II|nr:flavodoxin [Pseudomonadota bacterium]MEC8523861.1 flavodoxin [Pseudomonadota bacterium]
MSSLSEASVGIIFGTDTGNTEDVAEKISEQLEEAGIVAELINITDATPEQMQGFDLTIMGIPTWDFGGIQADWEDVEEMIQALDMGGKLVALYGLGDQFGYGDYFVDAMGWLQEHLEKAGARFIGYTSTEGYEFEASRAANEDKTQFCGLAIDEDQQFELTDGRISTWVKQVIAEYEAQA